MEEKIRIGLKELVSKGYDKFVIYPFGKYGKITKKILNEELHIEELYVVDKTFENNPMIMSLDKLRNDYCKEKFIILVAVDPRGWDVSLQIHRNLMEFATLDRIVDILSWSPFFTPWGHFDKINLRKQTKIALLESLAREVYKNNIKGSVAEAGVYQGETARFINLLFPDRKLFLFDTFEGFNIIDQKSDDKRNLYNEKLDFSQTSEEIVLKKMHFVDQCIIKKGWFPESAKDVNEKFALVRLDMDLYDPIYAGLKFFYPKMQKGGYIIVHDCRSKNFDGARMALVDFCKEKHIGYMCIHDNLGSAVISIGL